MKHSNLLKFAMLFLLIVAITISCRREIITPQNENSSEVTAQRQAATKLGADIHATEDYIIIATSEKSLPANLKADIAKLGGIIKGQVDGIGLAFAKSEDADFISKASKISGVRSVIYDLSTTWLPPDEDNSKITVSAAHTPTDFFYPLQWNMLAIHANEAWGKGYRGEGATVAILDGGFYLDHHDLAPNIDLSRSTSVVAGLPLQFQHPGEFSHGTHVAGIVAAPENNYGTVGVAPQAKLMLVRVLNDESSGNFGDVITGIYWAATYGADVINMSLGAYIPHHDEIVIDGKRINLTKETQELLVAMNRSTTYAYQKGAVIVCATGNENIDLGHIADYDHYPSGCVHTLSVSATSPKGWAINMNTNLDVPTTYTNYGTPGINFAAPGGDLYPDVAGNCNVPPATAPCNVFDLVISPGSIDNGTDAWWWAGGTSMASPHVAGVAALIAGKHPGYSPSQVEAVIRTSADDLGKPGRDDFYGDGRVNASKAVDQ